MVEEVDILFKNASIYNSYFKKFFQGYLAVKNKHKLELPLIPEV